MAKNTEIPDTLEIPAENKDVLLLQEEGLKTRFTLGQVGAPFGLDGFVKVKPFSGETGHFSRLGSVIIRQGGRETTREVAEVLPRGNFLLLRFAGLDSPEAAASLKGAEIIAGREFAAVLKEGEYYVEDLKGLEVVNSAGEALGHIADMIEGGGGNLAEVKLPSGEKRFVPFRNEFFGEINLEKNNIVLLEQWILDQ